MFEGTGHGRPTDESRALVRLMRTCHKGNVRSVFTKDDIEVTSAAKFAVDLANIMDGLSIEVRNRFPSFYNPRLIPSKQTTPSSDIELPTNSSSPPCEALSLPNQGGSNTTADLLRMGIHAVISKSILRSDDIEDCSSSAAIYRSHSLCVAVIANGSHHSILSPALPRIIVEEAARIAIQCARDQTEGLWMAESLPRKFNLCLANSCAGIFGSLGLDADKSRIVFGPADLAIFIADKNHYVVLGRGIARLSTGEQLLATTGTHRLKFRTSSVSSAVDSNNQSSNLQTDLTVIASGSTEDIMQMGACLQVGYNVWENGELPREHFDALSNLFNNGIDTQTLAAIIEREIILGYCKYCLDMGRQSPHKESLLRGLARLANTNASISADGILSKSYRDFILALQQSAYWNGDTLKPLRRCTSLPYPALTRGWDPAPDWASLFQNLAPQNLGAMLIVTQTP